MIDKIIPLWLRERSLRTIWFLTAPLIVACWSLSEKNSVFQAILQLENIIMVRIILSLLLLSLGLSLSLLLLHKRPKLKDYEIINPPGFMRHKTTGAYFCQPCLIQKHIASELSTISLKEFRCRNCNESYKIDYSVLICDKYLSMVHNKAVEELIHKKENV